MTVLDLLILFMITCIFYGGFYCGAKFSTIKEFFAAGKKALKGMLA